MIIKTLTTWEMVDDLLADEYAGWSNEGARALVNYLEQLSDDLGEDIVWDTVALRCDFTEFTSWDSVCGSYEMDEEDVREATICIDIPTGGVILQEF